jgi:hypothetical protein
MPGLIAVGVARGGVSSADGFCGAPVFTRGLNAMCAIVRSVT